MRQLKSDDVVPHAGTTSAGHPLGGSGAVPAAQCGELFVEDDVGHGGRSPSDRQYRRSSLPRRDPVAEHCPQHDSSGVGGGPSADPETKIRVKIRAVPRCAGIVSATG